VDAGRARLRRRRATRAKGQVHPTTSGYAVLADAVRDVLITAGLDAKPIDYVDLRTKER
jgi:hypothetical protein